MPLDFSSLALPTPLTKHLAQIGYQQMTAVQAASLPVVLAGKDLIAQAKTGSGKTAAFGLGILAQVDTRSTYVQALVLCPTRELATQVAKEMRRLASPIPNLKILTLCGGTPSAPQRASLEFGAHIVVGTPGRIQDLSRCGALSLRHVSILVLDEADRMLDMGFSEVIFSIIKSLPPSRQTLLFSATYPDSIQSMSRSIQRTPEFIRVKHEDNTPQIEQIFYEVEREEKLSALMQILARHHSTSTLIFCTTKERCKEIARALTQTGLSAAAIHGDLEQRDREKVLVHFANRSCSVLVATDVAARGLDIKDLPLVINFELSRDPEVHVHRIGRTGRAGENGLAISLFSAHETAKLQTIENYQKIKITTVSLRALDDAATKTLPPPPMLTLRIDSGKKHKMRAGDILGALTGDAKIPGNLVGKIDIFDFYSFVALDRSIANQALRRLSTGRIKGRQLRIEYSE